MAVTAKEIARQLGLSAASVSFALNGRPGVSAETRARVLKAAHALGYEFSDAREAESGTIVFVYYNRHKIFDTAFFSQMARGAKEATEGTGYRFATTEIASFRDITVQIQHLVELQPAGVLLLATEMGMNDLMPFAALDLPIVLLDTCHSCGLDRVQINNHEGAHIAVEYLFSRYGEMPGLLTCSNRISNFQDREDGYFLAVQRNGASARRAIVHELAADVAGAKQDMLAIIDAGEPVARSYFCDFDTIAQGAMQAFLERGYRIPEDVAFMGFDNAPESARSTPPLTTINVPATYMGSIGARRLIETLREGEHHPLTIEVGVSLIPRASS